MFNHFVRNILHLLRCKATEFISVEKENSVKL